MAKISNTISYPLVTPTVDDYVIGTSPGANPANQTSNFKLSGLKNLFEQDLQETLALGNLANFAIRLSDVGGVNILNLQSGGVVSEDGDLQVGTNALSSRLTLFSTDRTIINSGADLRINAATDTTIESGETITMVAGSGTFVGKLTLGTDAAQQQATTRMEFENGIIKAFTILDLASDGGVLLNGVAGAVGETLVSQGPGAPLAWGSPLPALANTTVFTGDINNNPVSTEIVTIDSTNGDVKIGNTSGPLAGTMTLYGKWSPQVYHEYGTENTSLGVEVMSDPSLVGTENVAVGTAAGAALTDTATSNTLVGYQAGTSINVANGNTLIGKGSDVISPITGRGTALGGGTAVANEAVALGSGSTAEKGCIAIGYQADAQIAAGANPIINFTNDVVDGLIANNNVYANNGDASVDLNPGDVYLLDNSTIGLPDFNNNGPAIMCMVYTA
jgi:hypothetical protein